MATVIAKSALDMSAFDFSHFHNAKKSVVNSHKSLITIDQRDGVEYKFYGKYSINYFAKSLSGTATKIVVDKWRHGHAVIWTATGIKLSAADVLKVAKTGKLSDDHALISKMFAHNDHVIGSSSADYLMGFGGNDVLDGRGGNDHLDGGSGSHDTADYSSRAAAITATLNGSHWVNALADGVAEDRIRNIENIRGGSGADVLTGDSHANALSGNGGADSLSGAAGNDTLSGGNGNDTLLGGSGRDVLSGGNDDDSLLGGSSNDTLAGGNGNDWLGGDAGNDSLSGSAGLDTLVGGAGRDIMSGGSGADNFVFLATSDSGITSTTRDYITDFTVGSDKLDVSLIDADETVDLDQAFVLDARGAASTAVATGHIGWYFIDKPGTANDRTILKINTDADAAPEMTIELKGHLHLTEADFIL